MDLDQGCHQKLGDKLYLEEDPGEEIKYLHK